MNSGAFVSFAFGCLATVTAGAQTTRTGEGTPPPNEITLSAGALRYNFDRSGAAPLMSLGVARHFGPNLILAADGSITKTFKARPPAATFDYDAFYSSFLASVQWQFPLGRLRPYVGAGVGSYNLNLTSDRVYAVDPACIGNLVCAVQTVKQSPATLHGMIQSELVGARFAITRAVTTGAELRVSNYSGCSEGAPVCQVEFRLNIGRQF